jgi:adenylate kinase
MRIVLLGPPAAGKGTQGGWLAARFGGAHLDTGELLRSHVERGTELGRTASGYMDRGELLPDELVIAVTAERLAEPDCAEEFVLDGFPRTVPQAEALDRLLAKRGKPLHAVVELQIPAEELHRRVAERAEEQDREDDEDDEALRRRIDTYMKETRSLVDYYLRRGLLLQVDGVGPVDEVSKRIEQRLAARTRELGGEPREGSR